MCVCSLATGCFLSKKNASGLFPAPGKYSGNHLGVKGGKHQKKKKNKKRKHYGSPVRCLKHLRRVLSEACSAKGVMPIWTCQCPAPRALVLFLFCLFFLRSVLLFGCFACLCACALACEGDILQKAVKPRKRPERGRPPPLVLFSGFNRQAFQAESRTC